MTWEIKKALSYSTRDTIGVALGVIGIFSFVITVFAAWATHIIWTIQTLASDAGATVGQVILALIGLCIPPVGVIHGIVIWFS